MTIRVTAWGLFFLSLKISKPETRIWITNSFFYEEEKVKPILRVSPCLLLPG